MRAKRNSAMRFIEEGLKNHGSDNDECLLWPYGTNDMDYGQIRIHGRAEYVHRVAFAKAMNKSVDEIPTNVLHSCDTPRCFNPKHLFDGTQADNMADCAKKNRIQYGERGSSHKLTNLQVLAARQLFNGGWRQKDIAALFGVSRGAVAGILQGRTWRRLK